jgi:hypothetical protein
MISRAAVHLAARRRRTARWCRPSNDVDLDHRGLIYVIGRMCGLDILDHTGG